MQKFGLKLKYFQDFFKDLFKCMDFPGFETAFFKFNGNELRRCTSHKNMVVTERKEKWLQNIQVKYMTAGQVI